MDDLDVLRGYLIASVLLGIVGFGAVSYTSSRWSLLARSLIATVVAVCGVGLFVILSFVPGWDAYFMTRAPSEEAVDYSGRYQQAAKFIRFLASLGASKLGIVFALLGLASGYVAVGCFRLYRRTAD